MQPLPYTFEQWCALRETPNIVVAGLVIFLALGLLALFTLFLACSLDDDKWKKEKGEMEKEIVRLRTWIEARGDRPSPGGTGRCGGGKGQNCSPAKSWAKTNNRGGKRKVEDMTFFGKIGQMAKDIGILRAILIAVMTLFVGKMYIDAWKRIRYLVVDETSEKGED